MISLVFTRRCNQYNAGEIAGFPDQEAQRLIDHGYAEPVGKPKSASPAAGISKEETADDASKQTKPDAAPVNPAVGAGNSASGKSAAAPAAKK